MVRGQSSGIQFQCRVWSQIRHAAFVRHEAQGEQGLSRNEIQSGVEIRPPESKSPRNWLSRYVSGLRVAVPGGAWAAVTATLVFWNASFLSWGWWAVLVGLAGGLVVTLLAGVVAALATAGNANVRRYVSLQNRIEYLGKEVAKNGGDTAASDLADVKAQLTLKGPQWITGGGFIDSSRGVHKVEADLLDLANARKLLEVAQTDWFRLTGSEIPDSNRQALLKDLQEPLNTLRAQASGPDADKPPTSAATAIAVKQVRQALNDYRDSSREGLSRLRIHSLDAAAVAGTLVYLLLVSVRAYDSLKPLSSGIAFFLVGALVGLLSSLQALSQMSAAIDDFGLASARLITHPILSGLAGVGGVLVISLLGAVGVQQAGLGQIFDVVNRPVGLVVAAAFGVAPAVLLGGFNSLAQRYAGGLSSTQPASTTPGSTGPT